MYKKRSFFASEPLKVPILWHLHIHIIPTNTDKEVRAQVYLGSKLKFEAVDEPDIARKAVVNYVVKNFCIIPEREAKKWMKESELDD